MTTVANFGGTSHHADLDGPVHWVDFGGPADGPRIVLVHGLGGSHLNWVLLAPLLARKARVTAVDLAGHGLTNPEGRQTTVQANTRLLGRFLREVVGEPVILVGNSMGGLISLFQTAYDPELVRGLVLVDPALPMVLGTRPDPAMLGTFFLYSVPGLGERFLARSKAVPARRQVERLLELVCADPSGIPEELKQASEHLIGERAKVEGLDRAFLDAARSVVFTSSKRGAYYGAMSKVRVPVFLMSGDRDRLVNVAAARYVARKYPHWRYDEYANVGHVPQMEIPEVVSERVLDWMDANRLSTSAS
ncbi:Pimeloyl-ACP methyl ester carboxylesterase [Lentzea waywayandensis]|uniref:Pimeloyl-ACP methyl ester carboxylesterase n=1 Tax=Lentzea waywayandensis TaxID=84724 RepID=A0A1I6FEQ2_9PSEU|nr:alpha/beta fold hydrolase [Lentzea waywayandensis]SFR28446.1 Pimeloyl-ACP methyl ester carboxylesterase [Lentzea waywayandensis]